MKKTVWHLLVVLGIGLVVYYAIPYVILNYLLSSEDQSMIISVILLMLINPLYSILSCLFYYMKNPFRWYLSVLVGLLFLPSIFLFYEPSLWPYTLGYICIAFIGSCVGFGIRRGHMIEKSKHKKKEHNEAEKQ